MNNTMLKSIFDKYNYPYFCFNLNQPIKDLLKKIEDDLIHKSYSINLCRSLIVDLWQYQRELERKEFESTSRFKKEIKNILKIPGYKEEDRFLVYKKIIPCTAIKTDSGFYILNDVQIKTLFDMGYCIQEFKVEKSKTISNVSCIGKHPNLDKFSNSFCLGSSLSNLEFTKNNLDILIQSFSQFNLVSVYIEQSELSSILEVLNVEKENY